MSAEYTRRPGEVLDLIIQLQGHEKDEIEWRGHSTDHTLTGEEMKRLNDSAEREHERFHTQALAYFDARQHRLAAVLEMMDQVAEGDDVASRWKALTGALLDDADRIFNAVLDGVPEPTKAGQGLKWGLQSQEALFAASLRDAAVPQRWATLVQLQVELLTMSSSLRGRWQAILGKLDELDRREQEIMDRLQETLRTAGVDAGQRSMEVDQKLRDVRDRLNKVAGSSDLLADARAVLAEVPDAVGAALTGLSAIALLWRQAREAALGHVRQLQTYREAELAVHRLFQEASKDAADFTQRPSPERAKDALSEAERLLQGWSGDLPTDGLRSDANAFAADLLKTGDHMAAALVAVYDGFRRENDGRFLGSPSSGVADQLLHSEDWRRRRAAIDGLDAPNSLRFLRDLIARFYDVDLERLYGALRAAVKDRVKAPDAAAARARDEVAAGLDEQGAGLAGKARAAQSEVLPALDAARDLLTWQEFLDLIGRTPVERSLKS